MKTYFFLILILLFSAYSCSREIESDENKEKKEYIFLGHIYRWHKTDKVDKRIEKIDFSKYDKILLGGDLCVASSTNYSTLTYLDKLFDLSSENTYWTIGNHDLYEGHPDRIKEFTGRDLFYAEFSAGFTIFNLNTRLDESSLNKQYNLFNNVCDTIENSSHLMMIMHNVVWDSVSTDFDADEFANGNYAQWHSRTVPFDFFYHSMYPKLVEVQNKGIQVMCISGDLGQRETKYFEFESKEGIQFLASGINNSVTADRERLSKLPPDHILVLEHNTTEKTIGWKFYNLDEFIKQF